MSRPNVMNADGSVGPMSDEDYAQYLIDIASGQASQQQQATDVQRRAMILRRAIVLDRTGTDANRIRAINLRKSVGA